MAVKLRMTRIGRRHRPFFRINAVEGRTPRDGKVLEKLGHYDPIEKDKDKQVVLNTERVKYWLEKGAIPSETVGQLLHRKNITSKHARKRGVRRARARALARAQGRFFTKAEKTAAENAAKAAEEKARAEAEAKAKQQKEIASAQAAEKADAN